MKYIGAHVSAAGGVHNAPLNAKSIGATAFALFTKNQKRWHAKPLTPEEIDLFQKNLKETSYLPEQVLPHDSYLINLGNPDKEKHRKSLSSFINEIKRVEALGLKYLNFHPGSHVRQTSEDHCLKLIAQGINEALSETSSAILVIENTAGQGSSVGYNFEHLKTLIDLTDDKKRIGVCLDTCHMFSAGYRLRSAEDREKTFKEFETTLGFSYLKGMHLNDAKTDLNSKVDRHAPIGEGFIGEEFFKAIMADKRFDEIPLILETPDPQKWSREIKFLKNSYQDS